MGPVEAVKTCMVKYVDFSGRASRSEYWWFTAFYVIAAECLRRLGVVLEPVIEIGGPNIFAGLFNFAIIIPILSSQVRRLHDVGYSGSWVFALYAGAISLAFLPNDSESLPVLFAMAAYGTIIVTIGIFVIIQYFRKTNVKGDKYNNEHTISSVRTVFS